MGHSYGYARVSTNQQDPALQLDALNAAGVERIFTDKASGAKASRPQLDELLRVLLPGDVVVVWRLDRLGRNLRHLIELVGQLEDRGVGFRSITESIDTTTSAGKLVFHVFAALAEFERQLIVERTTAGLEAARARGRHGGRPPKLTAAKLKTIRQLYEARTHTVQEIAEQFGVSPATVYRHVDTRAGRQ